MMDSSNAVLLVAHPGHELLLYGWLRRTKPFVCVLTDGSGHSATSRLRFTSELLASTGAREGPLFGRFTDREIYSAILEGRGGLISSLVAELADFLAGHRIDTLVTDAMEGFNPVHDLCRMIAGAACDLAGPVPRYEYPVDAGPWAYDGLPDATVHDLDELTLAQKLAAAHGMMQVIPDVAGMLARWGEISFRREAFRPIDDWTACPWPPGQRPLYERTGEERVAAGRYGHVIRYDEHFQPLLDILRPKSDPCVS